MNDCTYEQRMFNESIAGQQCLSYLKSIENTEIERKDADELRNKYSMLFYKETGFSSSVSYICNTYIPIVLFNQYNITVVDNKHIDNNSYYNTETNNKRKTAPTLADGWFIYILIMLFLSIFNDRILGWIFTTIVFALWRFNEINKYN